MKTDLTSNKNRLQLLSFTELYDGAFRPGLFDGNHYCYVKVFRLNNEIFKTGTFAFGAKPLRNVLSIISLAFKEKPFQLRYALYVFSSSNGQSIITVTPLNSILDITFIDGVQKARMKSTVQPSQIIQSVKSSVAAYRKKTIISAKAKSQSVKTPRQSPEYRDTITSYKATNILDGSSNVSSGSYRLLYRTYTGVRTPNFKALARTGQLPVNNYSMYRVVMAKGSYYHEYRYLYKPTKTTAGTIEEANYPPNLAWTDLPASHLTVDENTVVSRLQQKIQGSNAGLGEDAATFGQTINLVTKNATRLHDLFILLRGGAIPQYFKLLGNHKGANSFKKSYKQAVRQGKSGSKLLSELWLEYRFGLLPLLNDFEGSINAYARYVARNPRILTVEASATKSSLTTTYINNLAAIHPGTICGAKMVHTKTQCRMGLHYHVSSPVLALMNQLGLTSPIALGWELVPFSFLVDYLLPIGNALQAASAFEGLTFHSGYKRYRTEQRAQIDYNLTDSSTDATYDRFERMAGTGTGVAVNVQRTKLTSFPSTTIPSVKNPYSPIHAANAIALLVGALTRR